MAEALSHTVVNLRAVKQQENVDKFYWKSGPCCAGCDHWEYINSVCGDCTKSAPVSGHERTAMLGLRFNGISPGAGHVLTNREHRCGDFKDSFDWQSLSPAYLWRIGYKGEVRHEF